MSDWKEIIFYTLIPICIYIVLGGFFISSGTTIYDDIPENVTFYKYAPPYNINVRNAAPLTLPYVNPTFIVHIETTNGTECIVDTMKGKTHCEDVFIDLGYISLGEPQNIKISLIPNGSNFAIITNVYQDYKIYRHPAKNQTLYCVNQGNDLYSCKLL